MYVNQNSQIDISIDIFSSHKKLVARICDIK